MFRVAEQMPVRARRERGAAIRYAIVATLLSAGLAAPALPRATEEADPEALVAQAPPQSPWDAPQPSGWGYPAQGQGQPPHRAPSVATARTAIADAERDAIADTNGGLWFLAGCGIGIIGVILGYAVEPSPSPARLLGRSPEYVAAYTQSYVHAGKQEQGKRALTGCLVSGAAIVAFYAWVAVQMESMYVSGP